MTNNTGAASPPSGSVNMFEFSKSRRFDASNQKAVNPGRPLPQPTRDLATLTDDLDVHGFCFVAEAVKPDRLKLIRARIAEQLAAEDRIGRASNSPNGVRRLGNLLNKGAIFQETQLIPVVEEALKHLLGEEFLLSITSVIQCVPGSLAQGLHFDQFYYGLDVPIPLTVNTMLMVDEFTEDNGGTRIIPGSHLWSLEKRAAMYEGLGTATRNGAGEDPAGTVAATGPAGTVLVYEGRVMHGTGRNKSAGVRTGFVSVYTLPILRTVINHHLSITDENMASFPQALRDRLGYHCSGLAGGYLEAGRQPPSGVVRPTDQLGELR